LIVVAGSDAGSCGVPHGVGFIDELVHMQTAGMPPLAILNSATGVSAATLAFPDRIGRLAPGFRSRMILTRHDPLESVANLHKSKTVLFDGTVIQCPDRLDPAGL
jgi:imidazolonepropionase-like amidohydrolase